MVMCVNKRDLPRGVGLNSFENLFNWTPNDICYCIFGYLENQKSWSNRKISRIFSEILTVWEITEEEIPSNTNYIATDWRR